MVRGSSSKKAKSRHSWKKTSSPMIAELRLLERLINKFIEKLEKNGFEPKVQDALKAIQLKHKLAETSEAEKVFWDLIDQLRRQELSKAQRKTPPSDSKRKKE